jgi:hypothetical protein
MLGLCVFLLLFASVCAVEDLWSFIVIADWHGAESFALNPVNDETSTTNINKNGENAYADTLGVLKHINKNYGGELVVMPGDTNNGKWHEDKVRNRLEKKLEVTEMTTNEAIAIAGENCYSTSKRLFSEAGYDKILLTVGDHELGK